MAKLAICLVAVFALHSVIAAPTDQQQQQWQQQWQQQQQQGQQLWKQIQQVSNTASESIQNLQLQNNQDTLALRSLANEYANIVQIVAYTLQQAIQGSQIGQNQLQLQQVYRRLSEIAYSIQQAIDGQPIQLQAQLKVNIQNIVVEAERLQQIIQWSQQSLQNQQGQESQQSQGTQQLQGVQQVQGSQQPQDLQQLQQIRIILNDEILQALSDLLAAVQRLQAQTQIRNQNQEQIRSQIQSLVSQLTTLIQNINIQDQQAGENLAYLAIQLSQNLGIIINRLQRQLLIISQGETRNVLQQVTNKLSEIRATLEQAVTAQQNATPEAQVQLLQNRLKANIGNIAAQVERLLDLAQPTNQSNEQGQQLNLLLRNLLADALAAGLNLQSQIQILTQSNQTN